MRRSLPGPPSTPGFRRRRRALVELLDSVKMKCGEGEGRKGHRLTYFSIGGKEGEGGVGGGGGAREQGILPGPAAAAAHLVSSSFSLPSQSPSSLDFRSIHNPCLLCSCPRPPPRLTPCEHSARLRLGQGPRRPPRQPPPPATTSAAPTSPSTSPLVPAAPQLPASRARPRASSLAPHRPPLNQQRCSPRHGSHRRPPRRAPPPLDLLSPWSYSSPAQSSQVAVPAAALLRSSLSPSDPMSPCAPASSLPPGRRSASRSHRATDARSSCRLR
ncbi:formin-like protein 5 [Triticum urartu]|uniref:formin-like protein 5 n=1 Tax=Triticum urartu TaxID=4572 RepID=UPI002043C9AE|nr:formin-like protein 5 [Triticum urartu]